MNNVRIALVAVTAFVVLAAPSLPANPVTVVYPAKVDLSPPLRDLPAAVPVAPGESREINPLGIIPRPSPEA
ncbi:MAG: hypothetical protein KDB94_12980, partial [Acidobacteria bacterium]|nr:hypothetical protein [Acidobacteriota bacterium]